MTGNVFIFFFNSSRKSTPLSVAMGKGHLECVSAIMDLPGVDLNSKDDEGISKKDD